ncbi:MAG: SCP2 sterol-binding domain-containing protein [Rheinheimera sp.]|nr:SCP2 sterol-binding domain-containing protein [Rheinheimera sp.]
MLKLLWPGLLCTLGENVLNPLISMDPDALTRLQRLQGKQLAVCLRGIDIRLVLTAQQNGIWLNSHQEAVDCAVETEFSALQQLSDPSQLTRLIRENKLQIDGDLQTLQQFSQFFQQLNPDWQEKLAALLGDAVAHKATRAIVSLQHGIRHYLQQTDQTIQQLAQDELRLTPVAAEVQQFSREVSTVAGRTELLQRQLAGLLSQLQASS